MVTWRPGAGLSWGVARSQPSPAQPSPASGDQNWLAPGAHLVLGWSLVTSPRHRHTRIPLAASFRSTHTRAVSNVQTINVGCTWCFPTVHCPATRRAQHSCKYVQSAVRARRGVVCWGPQCMHRYYNEYTIIIFRERTYTNTLTLQKTELWHI